MPDISEQPFPAQEKSMKGLMRIFHNMGEALTLASAGEMLTDRDKHAVLGRFRGSYAAAPDAMLPRVVVASDQPFAPGILQQGIELCNENRALLDLLVEVDSYLRLRRDTMLILIQVGEELRWRAERYRRGLRWGSARHKPAVSLYEEVAAT
jgi:hypothetical protein